MATSKEDWNRSLPEIGMWQSEETHTVVAAEKKPSSSAISGVVRRLSESEQKIFCTPVNFKICHLGIATDLSYSSAYCTVNDGVLKLYSSINDTSANPIFEVVLDKNHRASPWQHKKWVKANENDHVEHVSYYVEEETFVGWVKVLKFGFLNVRVAERMLRCIETNTGNTTRKVVYGDLY